MRTKLYEKCERPKENSRACVRATNTLKRWKIVMRPHKPTYSTPVLLSLRVEQYSTRYQVEHFTTLRCHTSNNNITSLVYCVLGFL